MSTSSKNKNSLSAKKNIRFEHELIEAIEKQKNPLVPFGAWVKQACREKLERESAKVSTDANIRKEQKGNKKRTTLEERVQLIKDCYASGLDYKQTAVWLNDNGYLPQRGAEFTPNSVRGIAKQLKK